MSPNLAIAQGSLSQLHIFVYVSLLQIHEYTNHDSSVNSVQWAPHDFGLVSGVTKT